jgi:membrane protein DedA with SNARE-associated domain
LRKNNREDKMNKIIKYISISLVCISYAFANIVEQKENHFEKHIEFWLTIITITIVYTFYLYKKKQ